MAKPITDAELTSDLEALTEEIRQWIAEGYELINKVNLVWSDHTRRPQRNVIPSRGQSKTKLRRPSR